MSTSAIQSLPFTNTSTAATDTSTSYHLQYEKKQKNVSRLLATLIVPTTPAMDRIASVTLKSDGSNTTATVKIASTLQPVIPLTLPSTSTTTKGPAIIYPTGAPLQKQYVIMQQRGPRSIHLITPLKCDWFMVFCSCSRIRSHTYRLQHHWFSHFGTARHLLPEETSEIGEGTRPPTKLWHAGSHGEPGANGPQNKWVYKRWIPDRVIYGDTQSQWKCRRFIGFSCYLALGGPNI